MELRKRLKGKHAGDIYYVYVDPQGRQYYTLPLSSKVCWICIPRGAAEKEGFKDPQNRRQAAKKRPPCFFGARVLLEAGGRYEG